MAVLLAAAAAGAVCCCRQAATPRRAPLPPVQRRELPPASVCPIVGNYPERGRTLFRGADGRSRVIITGIPRGGVSPDSRAAGKILTDRETGKPDWLLRVFGPDGDVIRDVKLPYTQWLTDIRMSDDGSAVLVLTMSYADSLYDGTLQPLDKRGKPYEVPEHRAYFVTAEGEVRPVELPGTTYPVYSIGPSVWTCLSHTGSSYALFVFDGDKPRWSREFPLSALGSGQTGHPYLRRLGRSKYGDAITGLVLEFSPEESHCFDMDGNPIPKPEPPAPASP
jgi:hypothetical protein